MLRNSGSHQVRTSGMHSSQRSPSPAQNQPIAVQQTSSSSSCIPASLLFDVRLIPPRQTKNNNSGTSEQQSSPVNRKLASILGQQQRKMLQVNASNVEDKASLISSLQQKSSVDSQQQIEYLNSIKDTTHSSMIAYPQQGYADIAPTKPIKPSAAVKHAAAIKQMQQQQQQQPGVAGVTAVTGVVSNQVAVAPKQSKQQAESTGSVTFEGNSHHQKQEQHQFNIQSMSKSLYEPTSDVTHSHASPSRNLARIYNNQSQQQPIPPSILPTQSLDKSQLRNSVQQATPFSLSEFLGNQQHNKHSQLQQQSNSETSSSIVQQKNHNIHNKVEIFDCLEFSQKSEEIMRSASVESPISSMVQSQQQRSSGNKAKQSSSATKDKRKGSTCLPNSAAEAQKLKLLEELFYRRASPIKFVKSQNVVYCNKLRPIYQEAQKNKQSVTGGVGVIDSQQSTAATMTNGSQLGGEELTAHSMNKIFINKNIKKCIMVVSGGAVPENECKDVIIQSKDKLTQSQPLVPSRQQPLAPRLSISNKQELHQLENSSAAPVPPPTLQPIQKTQSNNRSNSSIICRIRSISSNSNNNNYSIGSQKKPSKKQLTMEKIEQIRKKCTDCSHFDPVSTVSGIVTPLPPPSEDLKKSGHGRYEDLRASTKLRFRAVSFNQVEESLQSQQLTTSSIVMTTTSKLIQQNSRQVEEQELESDGVKKSTGELNADECCEDDEDDDVDDDDSDDADVDENNIESAEGLQESKAIVVGGMSANTISGSAANRYDHLVLLSSVYEQRPATVFFPYPFECGQDAVRSVSRCIAATECQEKRFDMRFKVTTRSLNLSVLHAFQKAGIRETEDDDDWNISWGTGRENYSRRMVRFQKTNHFPQYSNMGRKDSLWKNLSRVKRRFPAEYDFIPTTYILQHQVDWERFLAKRDDAERGKLWIMKPSNQAQGKNIKMISKRSRVQRKQEYIICEYVANPHLIDGLKYDLRVYVLVTSYDPLRIYVFNDGLTRFATEKYSTNAKELSKRYVHLTNYSLNKHNPKFKQNSNAEQDSVGSKWSLQALFRKYREMGVDGDTVWEKIKDVIVKTCIAAEPYMLDTYSKCEEHRSNCFELYGFDILVDDTLKPWLLEVNVRPSLTSSSPLDRKIKHTLVCDAFNLIGLQPFDKKKLEDEAKRRIPGVSRRQPAQSKFLKDLCDLDEENCIEKLSADDWNMLFETDEENYRRGHFERIFPVKDKFEYYSQFFEFERYNNLVIRAWMNASENFLEKVLSKKSQENV